MGKVVHFEVPADDMKRAQKFYSEVFGWGIQEMPQMEYTIVQTMEMDEKMMPKESGAINGGMFKREDSKKYPVITVEVASIEKAAKVITAHGGKMTQERLPVGDMGFTAYFTDSEGNLMGLWEPVQK